MARFASIRQLNSAGLVIETKTEGELGELIETTLEEIVFEVTRAITPVVWPMVDALCSLQMEDVIEH